MMSGLMVDYSDACVAVRDDLARTHEAMLDYFRRPGCWFTGAERLAIAAESRNALDCDLCAQRKSSLSPEQPTGEHRRVSELPESLVEIAHRIRLDPQRLSREWYERIRTEGIEEGRYVELVGIVTFTAGIDSFCRALGFAPLPFPEPIAGPPSRYRPANLTGGIAWVPILLPENATGPEADLYDGDFVPNIARALSSVPDHVRLLQQESATHYMSMAEIPDASVRRHLNRLQMELVAARVSAMNECFY